MEIVPIAHIESPFGSKFGIPRQAGLVATRGRVVFEEGYRIGEAVRGLEGFDYIWLLWGFHQAQREGWSPTVRPPRLGGNRRIGVFATRSPFRPNNIGLSAVRLIGITFEEGLGAVLEIEGADLMDGTPIYDIKPYIPYADSYPEVKSGFAQEVPVAELEVSVDEAMLKVLPTEVRQPLIEVLSYDPRPRYQHDAERRYAMVYGQWEVGFRVEGKRLYVTDIEPVRGAQ